MRNEPGNMHPHQPITTGRRPTKPLRHNIMDVRHNIMDVLVPASPPRATNARVVRRIGLVDREDPVPTRSRLRGKALDPNEY